MARALRFLFGLLVLLIYLLSPLMDAWILRPPQSVIETARPLQFGLVVPALLALIACSLAKRLRRLSDVVTVITLLTIGYTSMQIRLAGHAAGFEIGSDWINVATLGAFFFNSMRLPPALIVGLGLLTLNIVTEISVAHGGVGLINLIYELESMAVIFALGLAGCYILEVNSRLTWLEASELEQRLDYDALTGALNRNRFRTLYRQRFQMAAREQISLCVAVLDIDHFKAYNDYFGHNRGDTCLANISRELHLFADQYDALCARLGGEEFALVFFVDQSSIAAERLNSLRQKIRLLAIEHPARPDGSSAVTVSIGAVVMIPDGRCNRFEALHRADKALYDAKEAGRDRVAIWGET